MLISKVSALGAVVPKEVLNAQRAQSFKTKPMGLDSVSFGMAKVPKLVTYDSLLWEKAYCDDEEGFKKAVKDCGDDTKTLYKALNRKFTQCNTDWYNSAQKTTMEAIAEKENKEYLITVIGAFSTGKLEDKKMLTELLSSVNVKTVLDLFDPKKPEDKSMFARVMFPVDPKIALDLFDPEKPEDNRMLAEVMLLFDPKPTHDSNVLSQYDLTIDRLATDCGDVPPELSLQMLNKALNGVYLGCTTAEKFTKARDWLLEHGKSE